VSRYGVVDRAWFPEITLIEIPDEDTIFSARMQKFKERWAAHDPPMAAQYDVEVLEFDPVVILQEANTSFEIIALSRMNAFARATNLAFAWSTNLDTLASNYPGGVPRLPSETYTEDESALEKTRRDNAYRRRIWLAPNTLAASGTSEAYEYFARTVDGDLRDCTAINPLEGEFRDPRADPGSVYVTMMANGDNPVPSTERLIAVRAYLHKREIKPRTDIISVMGPRVIPIAYDIGVWLYPNVDKPSALEGVASRVAGLVEAQRFLGVDHSPAWIGAAVRAPDVSDMVLYAPLQTVRANETEVVKVTSVRVRFLGFRE